MTLVPFLGLLLLLHLLYDFHWQGSYISAGKRTSILLLSVHAATWALFLAVPFYVFGAAHLVWLTLFLFVTHWAQDYWKSRKWPNTDVYLALDQLSHLLVLLVVTLISWPL